MPALNQQGLCDVTPEGYHHLTRMLMNLANGRVVIVLEVLYVFYIQCTLFFFFSTFDIAKMAQPNSIKRLIQFSPEINKEKGNPVPKPVFIFVHFAIA